MKSKKLLSLAVVLVMLFVMAIPAMALNITVENPINGDDAMYEGYKLFDLTTTLVDEDAYAYTLNSKYATIVETVLLGMGKLTEPYTNQDVINAVEGLDFDGLLAADEVREFANKVYLAIVAAEISADAESALGEFEDVDQGYWLIAEVFGVDGPGAGDAYSLVMLGTAGQEDLEVTIKKDTTTVEKLVYDDDLANWTNATDMNIGDIVKYQITATLPDNFVLYDEFFLKFVDTLSKGLTYNPYSYAVKVYDKDDTEINVVTNDFLIASSAKDDGSTTLTVTCEDILTIGGHTPAVGDTFVLTYTATLNKDAVVGNDGNPNEVYLEYTNDPYTFDLGETVTDDAIVYTWEFDIFKWTEGEGDVIQIALANAEFKLYRGEFTTLELITGDAIPLILVEAGDDVEAAVYRVATAAEIAANAALGTDAVDMTKIVTPASGLVNIIGLDSGDYTLVETKAPDGYNLLTLPVNVTISYTDNDGIWTQVAALADVENFTGIEFPDTGGIGRTIFTIVGGVLMVGAAVVLVAKKKAVAVK